MELVCDPNDEADLFLTVFKAKVPMFDLWFDLTYSTFDGVTGFVLSRLERMDVR